MLDDELKKIWQDAPMTEKIKFNHSKLLMNMDHELKLAEQKIKRRDFREILVAVLLIPYFLYIAYQSSNTLTQIGAVIIALSCVWIIYKLRAVRKYRKTDMTTSLKEQMTQTHEYLSQQRKLLDNVLTWYILPPSIGLVLFYIGMTSSVLALVIALIFQLAIMIWVYQINKKAANTYYTPMIKRLEKVIEELS